MPRRKKSANNPKQFGKTDAPRAVVENVVEDGTPLIVEQTFTPPNPEWQETWCRRFGIDDFVYVEYDDRGNKISHDFSIRKIKGDGNCFFRCLSCVLTGSEKNHELIRTLTVQHILLNRDEALEKFEFHCDIDSRLPEFTAKRVKAFNLHLENMAIPSNDLSHWATTLEVMAAASLFETDICMFQNLSGSDGGEARLGWQRYSRGLFQPTDDVPAIITPCAIFMKNTQNVHYDLVIGNRLSIQETCPVDSNVSAVAVGSNFVDNPSTSGLEAQKDRASSADVVGSNTCLSCGKTFIRLKTHLSKNAHCKSVHESLVNENNQSRAVKRKSYKTQKQRQYRAEETDESQAKRLRLQTQYDISHTERLRVKQKNYDTTHQEQVREKQAQYDSTHRDEVREKQANYNSTHRDEVREKQANYDSTHRDEVREKQAQYDSTHRDEVREKQANYNRTHQAILRTIATTRYQSKKSNTDELDRLKKFSKDVKFGPIFPCSVCHRNLYQNGVRKLTDKFREKLTASDIFEKCFSPLPRDDHYICHTCSRHLLQGNMPPQCVKNGLELDAIPNELQLSELGHVLIAKSILFFKLFKLPKSRWSALRDKMVHVPITDDDILNTLSNLNSLPRLPDEAGLVPVRFKRKVEYRNYILEAYIDPEKLIEALKKLKELGHPAYEKIEIRDYAQELQNRNDDMSMSDSDDDRLSHDEDANNGHIQHESNETVDDATDDETDNIRRFQSDDLSTVMSNDHPEIQINIPRSGNSSNNNSVSLAPGQGKMPTNLMRDDDWDVNSFPALYPTGKYGLKFPREIKMSPWKYFCQRLYNVDKRFASSNPYVFASLYYLERHAIEQQINISYLRGNVSSSGELTNVEDAYSVLDKLPGSPRYWKKQRNIMFAKLENLGPFLFFFTLSCADKRWTENFTSVFAQHNKKITYQVENGTETIYVDGESLDKVLERENLHEILRDNIDVVARNFNQRVRAFVKNIMMGANNQMRTEYYNHRIEFQARGAGHVHGVLWPRFNDLEADFPGISVALETLRKNGHLSETQKETVTRVVDAFISCSLDNDLRTTLEQVQIHNHSKTCRKYGTKCRFNFPRFPSERTIIAHPLRLEDFESEDVLDEEKSRCKETLRAVKEKLCELEDNDQLDHTSLDELLTMSNVSSEEYHNALAVSEKGTAIVLRRGVGEVYVNNYNPEWIRAWNANMDLQVCLDYYAVLTYITDYYMKDDSGTMQFLIDATKEYTGNNITDKMKYLANVFLTHRQKGKFEAFYSIDPSLHLTDSNIKSLYVDTNMPEKRRKFLVKIGDDDNQSTDLGDDDPAIQIEDENSGSELEDNIPATTTTTKNRIVTIPGKSGTYVERSLSLHSKYERRPPVLRNVCFVQFCTMYEICQRKSVKNPENVNDASMSDTMIANADLSVREYLPVIIELSGGMYMRLRKKPSVLRQYKAKEDKEPHQFFYAELLLYVPWVKEEECYPHDFDKCFEKYQAELPEIQTVKKKLFPHRNNVEEAQALIESLEDRHANHIGDILDPANAQEEEEMRAQGADIDEEFIIRNPEVLGEPREMGDLGSMFRRINVSDKDKMGDDVRKLDPDQRFVFDCMMRYFRDVRIATKKGERVRNTPLMAVHGGAGSGKSELIRIIAQWCEATLRTDDDRNPDQPFIILAAPTGTAASNIKGLTMHTAFSLPFGNKFMSLNDKKRDGVRTILERLKLVVIDEMSMVKADQLYQLNLRLQEIMGNSLYFGGVGVLLFGDLLQLRPVSAKYIFEEPSYEKFRLSKKWGGDLWKLFSKVELRHNHRQGEYRAYADALCRIRYGKKETPDMEMLRNRVTANIPLDAIHLFGTNAEVNRFNDEILKGMEGTEWVVPATNLHPTQRLYKPRIGNAGTVNDTPFQSILRVKVEARIMVTYNIELKDGLVNGAMGTIKQIKLNSGGDKPEQILVEFDDPEVGEMTRRCQNRPDRLVSIKRMSYEYSIGSKTNDNVTHLKVIQFPLRLAWAATVHKYQGQTVTLPRKLVGHMEKIYQKSQAYVLFGRVQSLDQLFLTCFDQDKMIKVDANALDEALVFQRHAINVPTRRWRDHTITDIIKVAALNIRSLSKHFADVSLDEELLSAHCICLTETWLQNDDTSCNLHLAGYTSFFCNAGRGKGVAVYTNLECVVSTERVSQQSFQLLKVTFQSFDLICAYRSPNHRPMEFAQSLRQLISQTRKTVICGDFNLDVSDRHLTDLKDDIQFNQLVTDPTHIEGNMLDHVYTNIDDVEYHKHPAYYSDHDIICVEFRR